MRLLYAKQEGNIIFNFKFNIRIIKFFLILIIITFFLPFFSVSCSRQDDGITFSGFELSTGKNIGEYRQNGNFLGFILIVPPVLLLLLSFLIYKTKKINIYKTIFFIAPIFNVFAVFIIKYTFNAALIKAAAAMNLNPEQVSLLINVKYGFILYIIFNAAVFIFSVLNYFIKRE